MAWQRFRVELVGHEPLEVQTSARDWASVPIDPNAPRAMDITFRVVHAALLRTGVDVPRDYLAFLDELDDVPTTEDEAPSLDPTTAAASASSP